MAKARKPPAPSKKRAGAEDPDAEDIAATMAALGPLIDAGVNAHRLASACGAHPEDLRGFLEGRVSLTPALRERLRAAAPSILESLDPRKQG